MKNGFLGLRISTIWFDSVFIGFSNKNPVQTNTFLFSPNTNQEVQFDTRKTQIKPLDPFSFWIFLYHSLIVCTLHYFSFKKSNMKLINIRIKNT